MTDGSQFETKSTWGKEGDVQIRDRSKIHSAWTGGKQEFWIKEELVSLIKNSKTSDLKKIMSNGLLMPMATAVWLVENTSLTFKQIAIL